MIETIDFSEKLFECKNRMAMCQMEQYHTDWVNPKCRPRNLDQTYWYYLGMHDGYNEIYLKLKERNEK